MAITDQDKRTVRMILRKTLYSAFPGELDPLTVQDVACYISSRWRWRELVFRWEAPILDHLLTVTTLMPVDLNDESVQVLLTDAGVEPGAFCGLFLEAANEMILVRANRERY